MKCLCLRTGVMYVIYYHTMLALVLYIYDFNELLPFFILVIALIFNLVFNLAISWKKLLRFNHDHIMISIKRTWYNWTSYFDPWIDVAVSTHKSQRPARTAFLVTSFATTLDQCFFGQNLFDDMYYTNLYGPVLPVKPNNFKNNSVY